MIQVGDYVVRISYNKDVMFKVIEIGANGQVKLKGISFRIIADAPIQDLELVGGMRFTNKEHSVMDKIQKSVDTVKKQHEDKKIHEQSILEKTGKVLHLDGDAFYLELCMRYYDMLGVRAVGESILEFQQPNQVVELIQKHNPDILVLTGHDALNKKPKNLSNLAEYKNSKYFVEAIKAARRTKGNLIIFAGACQSNFEALLDAGADYAASPGRVLIHALDPVFLVERIAHCPFNQVLPVEEAIQYTITHIEGIGGFEILGTARKGGPVAKKLVKGKYKQPSTKDVGSFNRESVKKTFKGIGENECIQGNDPYSENTEEAMEVQARKRGVPNNKSSKAMRRYR